MQNKNEVGFETEEIVKEPRLLAIEDLGSNLISPFLDTQTLRNLVHTSKGFYRLYSPVLDRIGAKQLLPYVINADFLSVQKLIKINLRLIFAKVTLDESQEILSPFQYALKVYDSRMLKLFLDSIKQHPEKEKFEKDLQKEILELDKDNLLDLMEIFRQYNHCIQIISSGKATNGKLTDELDKLGELQITLLPAHMMRDFFHEDETYWAKDSRFSKKFLPELSQSSVSQVDEQETKSRKLKAFIIDQSEEYEFLPPLSNLVNYLSELELKQFVLIRGEGIAYVTVYSSNIAQDPFFIQTMFQPAISYDLTCFQNLFERRVSEIKDLLASYAKSMENLVDQKPKNNLALYFFLPATDEKKVEELESIGVDSKIIPNVLLPRARSYS